MCAFAGADGAQGAGVLGEGQGQLCCRQTRGLQPSWTGQQRLLWRRSNEVAETCEVLLATPSGSSQGEAKVHHRSLPILSALKVSELLLWEAT